MLQIGQTKITHVRTTLSAWHTRDIHGCSAHTRSLTAHAPHPTYRVQFSQSRTSITQHNTTQHNTTYHYSTTHRAVQHNTQHTRSEPRHAPHDTRHMGRNRAQGGVPWGGCSRRWKRCQCSCTSGLTLATFLWMLMYIPKRMQLWKWDKTLVACAQILRLTTCENKCAHACALRCQFV